MGTFYDEFLRIFELWLLIESLVLGIRISKCQRKFLESSELVVGHQKDFLIPWPIVLHSVTLRGVTGTDLSNFALN